LLSAVLTEAIFAYHRHKVIIPLKVEADYNPDGWLAAMIMDIIYYDFSTEDKFGHEWTRLHDRLKNILPAEAVAPRNKSKT